MTQAARPPGVHTNPLPVGCTACTATFLRSLKKKKHSTLGGCHDVMSSVFLSRNHRLGYTGCTQHTARHLATLVIVHQSSWNMAVEEPGRALFFHGTTLSCAEHTKLAMNYAESAEYCTCTPSPGVPLRGLSCHQLFGVLVGGCLGFV